MDTVYKHSYNSEITEKYAFKLLKRMGCKNIIKLDTDKTFQKHKNTNLSTPDFIIPYDKIDKVNFTNNPNDFYIDVVEMTGSMWNNDDDKHPQLKKGNILKAVRGNILLNKDDISKIKQNYVNSTFTNSSPLRLGGIEKLKRIKRFKESIEAKEEITWSPEQYNEKIIEDLWKPFNKKIKKYGDKRNSQKVGVIFVESPMSGVAQHHHFETMIWLIFDAISTSLYIRGIIDNDKFNKNIDFIKDILINKVKGKIFLVGEWSSILSQNQKSKNQVFTPLYGPFYSPNWMFLMIAGMNKFKGTTICFINEETFNLHKHENSPDIKWIKKLRTQSYRMYTEDEVKKSIRGLR